MSPRRQRGVVLIAMLAIIVMGAAWFTVRQLHAMSSDYTAANRAYNAAVLARAKAALMGHVALQAAKAGESDPGRFPCPEGAGFAGGGLEGSTGTPCAFPAVGRFPWRTVGTEKFLDASGEPLWYVVASGWALGATGSLVINPNCSTDNTMVCNAGQLTVDGGKDTVALIIAPGPAMNVGASAGCTARNQLVTRTTPSPAIDPRDYIECYNIATATFASRAPSSSFNDQAVRITTTEILPVIQGAVADRIQHEIGAQMRSAYSGALPGSPGNLWAGTTVLPFPSPFGDPTTSSFKGSSAGTLFAGTYQGFGPFNYAFTASPGSAAACTPAPCTPAPCNPAADARCDPGFVAWQSATITRTGGALLGSYNCVPAGTPSVLTCDIYTYDFLNSNAFMTFTFVPRASNVGMALRQVNPTVPIGGVDTSASGLNLPYGYTIAPGAAVINADGSASVTMSARIPAGTGAPLGISLLCGILSQLFLLTCNHNTVTVPIAVFSDHELVDPGNSNAAAGFVDHSWFFRNKWHEFSYYALAAGVAPSGARSCTTGATCLNVAYHPSVGKQRAIIVLGGAKLGMQARPPVVVADLLEGRNADLDTTFTVNGAPLIRNRTFNDHIAVIDSN